MFANGVPVSTFNTSVVTNMAKLVTGLDLSRKFSGATAKTNNPAYYFGQMIPVESEHDTTAKAIFGNVMVQRPRVRPRDGYRVAAGCLL